MLQNNFEDLFTRRNPKHVFLLSRMRAAMGIEEVKFADINSVNLRAFKDYMEDEVTANTLKVYNAVICATVREMFNDGLIPNAKCLSVLKVKAEPQQNVCLTPDEVERMWNYYHRLQRTKENELTIGVLALFLCECFTGARGCDVERFTTDNIQDGYLVYVSKKTKTLTRVVAHKRLPELFGDIPHREISRMTKNRIIKEVAKRCGITETISIFYHGEQRKWQKYRFLGFHCARRSFVSNLIDLNVPITIVSKMAGHSDVKMTQKYYVNQNYKLPEEALSFFE